MQGERDRKRTAFRAGLHRVLRHRSLLAGALAARTAWEVAPLQRPILAAVVVDALSGGPIRTYGFSWPAQRPQEAIVWAALGLLLLAVVTGAGAAIHSLLSQRLGALVAAELREDLARAIFIAPTRRLHDFDPGDVASRLTRDCDNVRLLATDVLIRAPAAMFRAAYLIVFLFCTDVGLALLAVSVIPLHSLAGLLLNRRLDRAVRSGARRHSKLTAVVRDAIDAAFRPVGSGLDSFAKIESQLGRLGRSRARGGRCKSLQQGLAWTMTSAGVALVWWQGGMRAAAGEITLGTLVTVSGMALFLYRPVRSSNRSANGYRRSMASLERVQELLALAPSKPEEKEPGGDSDSGDLQFTEPAKAPAG